VSTAAALVRKLFAPPGYALDVQAQAASVHADLLDQACAEADVDLARSLAAVQGFVHDRTQRTFRRRLLCHPLFIEGLHGLAPVCPALRHWHESVAPDRPLSSTIDGDPAARASLGHVALACRFRIEDDLHGKYALCTDCLGRLGFPFSDWTLTLYTEDRQGWLGGQVVEVTLDNDQACWSVAGDAQLPFLLLSRPVCRCLVLGEGELGDGEGLGCCHSHVRPRWQCACPLGHGAINYDAIGIQDPHHGGLTGGLVQSLLGAIRHHSPAIYQELRAYLYTIRGFEFPPSSLGVVGSFSDPTLPGIMGINVPYTALDEPCLDPFCFTWFGHELAHTKDYLNDTILYGCGKSLLRNPGEFTDVVPRYGRSLAVRTLFQIPYTHLYEWTMLMDFWEGGFHELPWSVPGQIAPVGEALQAEIVEAFTLLEERAQLTSLGGVALRHFHDLFSLVQGRWRSLRLSA
jgi:hypothetical protein